MGPAGAVGPAGPVGARSAVPEGGTGPVAGTAPAGATAAGPAPRAVDPDVDLHVPEQRSEATGRALWGTLAAVSAGGALGACARYGLTLAWPAPPGAAPWAVLAVNATGSALIGVLMVLVSERPDASPHPLLRPFLGTGVLGGFTTFSTYAADVTGLLTRGETPVALAYAAGTLAAALAGVWAAAVLTRRAAGPRGGRAAVDTAGSGADTAPGVGTPSGTDTSSGTEAQAR